jgi:hypothetical protein
MDRWKVLFMARINQSILLRLQPSRAICGRVGVGVIVGVGVRSLLVDVDHSERCRLVKFA